MDAMPAQMPAEKNAMPPKVEAPPAPPNGYSERSVRDLVKAVGNALKMVSKALGREAPPMPEPPKELFVKKVMNQPLPAFMVEEIANLLALGAQIGGKQEGRYDVDLAEMLADSDGLERLIVVLELMAKDKALLANVKEAAKSAPMPAEKETVVEETEEVTTDPETPGEAHASTYM